MKKVFKKILLSALCVLLGTSFAFSKDIVNVEIAQWPTKLPFTDLGHVDLTGLKITIFYDDKSQEEIGYSSVVNDDNNPIWVSNPANMAPIGKNEIKDIEVSYQGFSLASFKSNALPTDPLPVKENHTAHFVSMGGTVDVTTLESHLIDLPLDPENIGNLEFCGWAKNEIAQVTSDQPQFITSLEKMGNHDVSYYAVYAINNGYTDTYQFTINKDNYEGPISVKMVDGNDFKISLSNSNITIDGDKLVLGRDRGIITSAQSGSITNTTDLGKVTGIEIADNSNISKSGVGTGKFTVSTSNKKGTASSITVTFQKNREETFYVTTQPQINFVATDAKDKKGQSPSYYATFSCPVNVVISSANVEAYYVTVDEYGKLNLNEAGEKIDGKLHLLENTGYLLKYNQNDTIDYNFEKIAYGSSSEPNMLVPCPATAVFKPEADGNYYYKLAYGNNTEKSNLGFWWGKNDGSGNFKVKAGGALLCVDPQSQAASLMRGLAFEQISGNETGLEEEMIIEDCSPAIYNLSGQRVNSVNKSGLYIVNGKTRWVNVK